MQKPLLLYHTYVYFLLLFKDKTKHLLFKAIEKDFQEECLFLYKNMSCRVTLKQWYKAIQYIIQCKW